MDNLERILVHPGATIRETMKLVSRVGIVLLVDDDRHLIGTVTDGDIRRAILDGVDLDAPATMLHDYHPGRSWDPITAPAASRRADVLKLMRSYEIRHVPLLDNDGRVVDLAQLSDFVGQPEIPLTAVVMAGGYGKRLRPLTKDTPKPMLQVGDRPLMEHTLSQLRESGVRHISISTHFMAEKIKEHFGDGERFGVEIEYVSEDQPLGTAGALGLVKPVDQPILVINGDILTRLDFQAMLRFHNDHQADLTVGVQQYDLQMPYGVVQTDGPRIVDLLEKPLYTVLVNAGIYLLSPAAHRAIPVGEPFDMTDLINTLLANGRTVVSFPIIEYWIDIGQEEDYRRAQQDVEEGRFTG